MAEDMSEILDFEPSEDCPRATENCWEGFPNKVAPTMKVLGVTFDRFYSLDEHYSSVIAKAQMRQGISSTATKRDWRLEIGLLKMTRDAGISSLLRYALVVTGSCYPPDLIRSANRRIANIAAGKIGGAARSARSESLHFTVGTDAIYNLDVRHCADFLDACLRLSNSTINTRLRKEPIVFYGLETFEATDI